MKGTINKQEVPEEDIKLDDLLNELNELTGLSEVKKDIKSLINLLKVKKLREERGMKQPEMSLHMVFPGIRELVKQPLPVCSPKSTNVSVSCRVVSWSRLTVPT